MFHDTTLVISHTYYLTPKKDQDSSQNNAAKGEGEIGGEKRKSVLTDDKSHSPGHFSTWHAKGYTIVASFSLVAISKTPYQTCQ